MALSCIQLVIKLHAAIPMMPRDILLLQHERSAAVRACMHELQRMWWQDRTLSDVGLAVGLAVGCTG